ncbi:sigma factor-like helix-turn-helix DNA-binding protein [Demequina globuliformis]|uniref:sigma factor-like helix-turn-helix DNA-binding protein n=1 Tax=Demequina globuliformis TaxID=676202 RepID=UPI000784E988|nr:sigma-70 region 4 domain-containing protein [Demequina globuliformis]
MGDRTHLIEEVLAESGARLGAYGWLLAGSESAAADLVQSAMVEALSRARRPRDAEATEDAVRAQMRRLAARDAKRAQRGRDHEELGEAAAAIPADRASLAAGEPGRESDSAGADAVDLSAWEYRPHQEASPAPASTASGAGADDVSGPALTYDASLWEPPAPGQGSDAVKGGSGEEPQAAPEDDRHDVREGDDAVLADLDGSVPELRDEQGRHADAPGAVALARALSGLEPRVRVAVVMAEIDHLETEQIARAMRLPAHAVEADVAFGRSELARALGIAHAHHAEHVDLVPGGAR